MTSKDTAEYIKPMDRDDRATKILSVALEEQRRFHSELTNAYEIITKNAINYIAIILAILTFLYSGALDDSKSTQEKLFIPTELYGMLFYYVALGFIVYALYILARGIWPLDQWHVYSDITEEKVLGKIDSDITEQEYLQAMVNGYEDCTKKNLKTHDRKSKAIRTAFPPMVLGAIILIVLRFFGT